MSDFDNIAPDEWESAQATLDNLAPTTALYAVLRAALAHRPKPTLADGMYARLDGAGALRLFFVRDGQRGVYLDEEYDCLIDPTPLPADTSNWRRIDMPPITDDLLNKAVDEFTSRIGSRRDGMEDVFRNVLGMRREGRSDD